MKKWVLSLVSLLLTTGVMAQRLELTLDSCISMAVKNNKDLAISQMKEQVAKLNRKEAFYLRQVGDAASLCRDINNPGVRCMGDFWHMTWEENSDMGAFQSAGEYLQHVHVASRKRRSMPGEDGEADNYVEGFRALKMMGYDKYVSFECGCQGDRNVVLLAAVELLRKQWEEA